MGTVCFGYPDRKEERGMRTWNRMTQWQMERVSGGLLAIVMTTVSCFFAGASFGGIVAGAVKNNK